MWWISGNSTHTSTHSRQTDVCADRLREWLGQGENVAVVDLAKAYIQIWIHSSLWPYQTVSFRGLRYCLTGLGFGLNLAPLVMKAVLNCVLSQDPDAEGTSAYIDDILVNEDIVTTSGGEENLRNFGLTGKHAEPLANGATALGLRVWEEQGSLVWEETARWRRHQVNWRGGQSSRTSSNLWATILWAADFEYQ